MSSLAEVKSKIYTLEKYGLKDLWVKLTTLDGLPYGKARSALKELEKLNLDEASRMTTDTMIEAAKTLLPICIIAWNLPYPDDDNRIMPIPSKDPDIVYELPLWLIAEIFSWLAPAPEDQLIPPGKGT